MKTILLALVVLSGCGPDLELPARPIAVDAGVSTFDAGGSKPSPLEECRAVCPVGSTASLGPTGSCVCSL